MKSYIVFLVSVCLCLFSCTKDNGEGPVTGTEEREVEMDFVVPGATTRAAIEQESSIHDLTLLVCKGSGEEAEYQYSRSAWRAGGTNSFKTTLKMGEGLTIYFAVNARDLLAGLESDVLIEGNTWGAISKKLVMHTPSSLSPDKGLPMWAMRANQTISEKPSIHLGTIHLLRSVASADIFITGGNFILREGFVAFAADMGYLAYDPQRIGAVDNKLSVQAPYCPPQMKSNVDLNYVVDAGESAIANVFYMYENDSPLEPVSPDKRPTKIILKGIWDDPQGSGTATYYPLAIRDKADNGEYIKKQVTRNNKYTIMVTNVNGDGYASLEEAKEADDIHLDYEVIEWDDNEDGELIIDGPKYFYREASSIKLARNAGKTGEIVFRTNYDLSQIRMQLDSGTESANGVVDTHNRFKAAVMTLTDHSGKTYSCFRFTTKQEYGTSDNPAILRVTIGRIMFHIHVEQIDSDPQDWNNGGTVGGDLG